MTFRQAMRKYLAPLLMLMTWSVALYAQTPAPPGSIHGLVKSGNMPLPGVTVTATNTLTGQKVITWTDVDGNYFLDIPSNGRYVVRTQMAAFATATQELLINASNKDQKADLELILLSRVPPATTPGANDQMQQAATAMGARGFQNLQVAQGTDYTPTTGTDQ